MKFKLVESYKPEFEPYTYAEVLESMNGNVSDEEIDKFIRFMNRIARLLKTKSDKVLAYRNDEELDHNRFVKSESAVIAGQNVVIYKDSENDEIVCVREYINGNYWYYVASKANFTENFFEYDYDERDSEYGNYSPSAPWNAPGMKVSDFLPEKLV